MTEDLTQIRDRDSRALKDLKEELNEARTDYNAYFKDFDRQRDLT